MMALTQVTVNFELPFPAEVRNMIYRLLLTTPHQIVIGVTGILSFPHGVLTRPDLNILRVSKAAKREAFPTFFDVNNFLMVRPLYLFCQANAFGRPKLNNIKHLTLVNPSLLLKTRMKELQRLPNLQKVTINWEWGPYPYGGYSSTPVRVDLTSRDEIYGDRVYEGTRRKIISWTSSVQWWGELRAFLVARPAVKVELVMRPVDARVPHMYKADFQLDKLRMTFRITPDEASGGYVFHWEHEEPAV